MRGGVMPSRKAEAEWKGNLIQGGGRLAVESGAFEGPYTFKSRIEDGQSATNPEELLGAAHAGCFTMALTAELSRARKLGGQRHRKAAGMGGAEELFGIGSRLAVFDSRLERIRPLEGAAFDCESSAPLDQVTFPLCFSFAAWHDTSTHWPSKMREGA